MGESGRGRRRPAHIARVSSRGPPAILKTNTQHKNSLFILVLFVGKGAPEFAWKNHKL